MTGLHPVVAFVATVGAGDRVLLDGLLASMRAQTDGAWSLVVVDLGPPAVPPSGPRWEADDPRTARRHVEEATVAEVLDAELLGTSAALVGLLPAAARLAPGAVAALRSALAEVPEATLVYSDEDRLGPDGRHRDPWHKPAFSPDRLRVQHYVGQLAVYAPHAVGAAGGVRAAAGVLDDGVLDGRGRVHDAVLHDLTLRVAEQATAVVHVPRLLYHAVTPEHGSAGPGAGASEARAADARDAEARRRVTARHLVRCGVPARAVARTADHAAIEPELPRCPPVSLVVPTGCGHRLVAGRRIRLVDNLLASLAATTYPEVEVVLVADRTTEDDDLAEVVRAAQHPVRVVRDAEPFNFARASNLGAIAARGEVLVFLNDDCEVRQPEWLDRLVLWATLPGVGAVGARLHYGDGRVQHAGIFCRRGWPVHRYWQYPGDEPGYHDALAVPQDVLAVTGACLAVRADHFHAVGGFALTFPLNFNDVDLCLKLRQRGLRTVQDNATVLAHLESSTRAAGIASDEHERFLARWRDMVQEDPYDNPNLDGPQVEELPAPPALSLQRERWLPLLPRVWSGGGAGGFGGEPDRS